MSRAPVVGDKVRCQFVNFTNGQPYGREWVATVLEIDPEHVVGDKWSAPYKVEEPATGSAWLMHREILGKV